MSENFSLDSSEINYVVEIINYISECCMDICDIHISLIIIERHN